MKRCNFILILTLKSFLGTWEERSIFIRYPGMRGISSINSKRWSNLWTRLYCWHYRMYIECTNRKLFLDLAQKT